MLQSLFDSPAAMARTFAIGGVLLLCLGLQLRFVESVTLTPQATRLLAKVSGPPEQSVRGQFRELFVQTTQPRHEITPPDWLGWASLSSGGVLTLYGMSQAWRK